MASESAEAQPEVTRAAGSGAAPRFARPRRCAALPEFTYFREATCIASTTSGRMSDPVRAVKVPAALMNERIPSSWITSRAAGRS